jgi:hypothetical protein
VAKQEWHRPLVDFVGGFVDHPDFAIAALFHRSDAPTLAIDLGFAEYQRLLDQREQALDLGVNVGAGGDAVRAEVHASGPAVDALLRFPEGPAESLVGASWPLEVVVDGDETLLDLHSFSLAPADETWLLTWGYMEALRRADVLAPRVELVRLILNGSDWGLYVLEEEPSVDWLKAHGRPGIVVAFDAGTYWDAVARLGDTVPGSGFQYAGVTAGPPCNDEDGEHATACNEAVELLRQLRDGEVSPTVVLDAGRMAALVAQNTLWRGTMALDWRSLRFAYTPATQRLEPIATGAAFSATAPLPDSITAAPELQVATAQALAALAQPETLAALQDDLSPEMTSNRLELAADMGYVPMPWQTVEDHRATIQRQLAPSQLILATVSTDGSALVLRLTNPQPFPVEITGVDVGENAFLTPDPAWVSESDRQALVEGSGGLVLRAAAGSQASSIRLRVPTTAFTTSADQASEEVRLTTRLYGLDTQQIVVATWESDGGGR